MPTEESPECDTRVSETYQMPLPTWQMEEVPDWETGWSRTGKEAETIPPKGDKDLECPLELEPFLQKLLEGEESSEAEGKLPPPPQSMPKDPEPSHLCHAEWIKWCSRHVSMLSCRKNF